MRPGPADSHGVPLVVVEREMAVVVQAHRAVAEVEDEVHVAGHELHGQEVVVAAAVVQQDAVGLAGLELAWNGATLDRAGEEADRARPGRSGPKRTESSTWK